MTETGSSLRANNLRIVDIVCTSTTRLICNKESWADEFKRTKLERIALLLKAVLAAENRVGLMFNIRRDSVEKVLEYLPALRRPTVSPLVDQEWVALSTVIEEHVVREIIPDLKDAGAEGIVEYSLNKVVE